MCVSENILSSSFLFTNCLRSSWLMQIAFFHQWGLATVAGSLSFFLNSISNNRALVILQNVSEEWTALPWLTASYSSQWTNVVVFYLLL